MLPGEEGRIRKDLEREVKTDLEGPKKTREKKAAASVMGVNTGAHIQVGRNRLFLETR